MKSKVLGNSTATGNLVHSQVGQTLLSKRRRGKKVGGLKGSPRKAQKKGRNPLSVPNKRRVQRTRVWWGVGRGWESRGKKKISPDV